MADDLDPDADLGLGEDTEMADTPVEEPVIGEPEASTIDEEDLSVGTLLFANG